MKRRNYVLENRAAQQTAALRNYNATRDWYRREIENIQRDDDPSHQTPQYRHWRFEKLKAEAVLKFRPVVKGLVDQNDLGVNESASEYKKALAEYKQSSNPARVDIETREFAGKLRSAELSKRHPTDTTGLDALIAEAKDSSDADTRRAARIALRDYVAQTSKSELPELRRWSNSQNRLVADWEASDEPEHVAELRQMAQEWETAGNAALQELRRMDEEITPMRGLGRGHFGDLYPKSPAQLEEEAEMLKSAEAIAAGIAQSRAQRAAETAEMQRARLS